MSFRIQNSSIGWATPAKIVAKAKNEPITAKESQRSMKAGDEDSRSTFVVDERLDGSEEVIDVGLENQVPRVDAFFNVYQEGKNGSLKHWWNRMSNR